MPLSKRFYCLIIALGCLTLLGSCGYQLQKPLQLNASLEPVYVAGNSELSLLLKRWLLREGVQLSNTRNSAASIMQFSEYDSESRNYSLREDGRDAEFLRRHFITFEWLADNTGLISRQALYAEAIQVARPDDVAAQNTESEVIVADLNQQLVEQVLELIRSANDNR